MTKVVFFASKAGLYLGLISMTTGLRTPCSFCMSPDAYANQAGVLVSGGVMDCGMQGTTNSESLARLNTTWITKAHQRHGTGTRRPNKVLLLELYRCTTCQVVE